ncbi:transposase [Butyrivibrio sp. MC2013]|uniref:transposase n=1 Tax=Butyrivibrio sp. MC2013 TaxID=1280686 RepID=UPI000404FCA7|nr:transposase [Butyrivibrio sp. MC2013]
MPRKPRTLSSTGIYHIILRSVNQHIIFEEESDYQKFLFVLSDCKEKYDIDIYAYCLMDNHIHLLVYIPDDKLPSFFQSLGSRFVRWYNNKYLRSGHLFQERFHSSVIENDKAFLSALIYIHNNPVKANMCNYMSEYRWSSINAYYGAKNPLVNVSFAYQIAGSKSSLLHFFAKEATSSESSLFAEDHPESNHFLTDEKALSIFKSITGLHSTSDVTYLPKVQRNNYVRALKGKGLTIKQIARIMDISGTTVKRITKIVH